MSKFVLVAARSGAEILASEYRDFLVATGLDGEQLDHVILDSVQATTGDLSSYDGIFIGGSPFNITDAEHSPEQTHVQRELIGLLDIPVPKFFVCFGQSLLTHELGGTVGTTHGESAGPTEVELTDDGLRDPLLQGVAPRFEALTGHTESVEKLPAEAVLLATGPTCPVQMFRVGEQTWACQFHSDLDAQGLESRMRFYLDKGYFDPAEFDAIVQRIQKVDTSNAARILRNFVALCS